MSSATRLLSLCAVGLALLPACAPKRVTVPTPSPAPLLPVITFTVQEGAFAEAKVVRVVDLATWYARRFLAARSYLE